MRIKTLRIGTVLFFGIFLILTMNIATVWGQLDNEEEISEVLIGDELRYVEVGDKYLWLATAEGVSRYHFKSKEWNIFTTKDGLISNQVNCIAIEWKQGVFGKKPTERIWFGTDSGLSVYDMKKNQWQSYTVKDGLVENKIRCISARGNWIWIGTEKGASAYHRKKNRWRSYSNFPGIQSPSVTGILHDSKYVWIGTNSGLARYNVKYDKWEYFTSRASSWISPRGGNRGVPRSPLLSDRIYDIEGSGDMVYIATSAGLVRVTNKKFLSSADYVLEKKAYGQLKSPQRYNASLRARGRQLAGETRRSRLRALEAEQDRAQRSFDRKEGDAWAALGWEIFQPSMSVQNKEKREQISNQILALAISSGQVWMATNNGLLMFDTKMGAMSWYQRNMGLASNQINSLAIKGNTIWIGTVHGLSKFGTLSGKWKNYRKERTLPSGYVLAIGEDAEGVWLATPKAISQFNPETERWKTYTNEDGLGGGIVTCLDVVGNSVWVGSDQGISRLDKSNATWDYFRAAKSGLVADEITSILVDGKHIWVGTKRGLNRYDNTTDKWTAFSTRLGLSDDQITDLAADATYVWVGTEKGLSRYDKSKDNWEKTSDLGEIPIFSISEADEKICVSTENGIHLLSNKGSGWQRINIDSTLGSDVIELDGDKLWIGGWKHLMWYDIPSGQIRRFTDEDAKGLSRVRIHDIRSSSRYVWVATDGGIYRYNKGTDSWWMYAPSRERGSTEVLVDKDIRAIAVGEEFVFFGTPQGISRYDKVTETWLNYTTKNGLVHNYVSSLLWQGDRLWVGTYGGISKYNLILDRWTSFTQADGLCDNRINAITWNEGILWIGTQKGVSRYDTKMDTWQTYTKRHGLPDDVVWAAAVDADNLWFGTNRGVARYTPSEDKWKIYTTDDGLINNIVTSIRVEKKYIFLTTPAGVTMYDKEVESLTPYSQADGLAASDAKSIGSKEKYNWFGTSNGVTLYNQITDLSRDFTEAQGLPSNNVQVIAIDGDEIWFGTDAGLARHHWIRGEWTTYSEGPTEVASIASDLLSNNVKAVASSGDELWVGTRLGLAKYDKIAHTWHIADLEYNPLRLEENERIDDLERNIDKTVKAVESALQANSPTKTQKIYVEYDPEVAKEKAIRALQSMVVGKTQQPGDPTVPSPFVTVDVKFPPLPSVRVVTPILGQLWLGTEAGVIVYDKATGWVREIHPLLPAVRDIKYHDRKVWVLTDDQISVYDRAADSWVLFSNGQVVEHTRIQNAPGITEKLETASANWGIRDCTGMAFLENQIWLGRESGLKIFETDSRRIKVATKMDIPEYLQNVEITALASDGQDVWVGTRNGLFQYRSEDGNWETYTVLNGLAGNDISTITAGDTLVWVGTSEEGVSRYDKAAQKWKSFNIDDGLSDNNIRSIALDGKYIWMGTFSAGVCRYDLTTELWTTYRTADYSTLVSGN